MNRTSRLHCTFIFTVRNCCGGKEDRPRPGNELFGAGGGLHRPNHWYEAPLTGNVPVADRNFGGNIFSFLRL
jgi:hypothetical protein